MAYGDGNPRTIKKAAIKRGTREGQRRIYAVDRAALNQLQQVYQRARDDIEQRIHAAADIDGTVRLKNLKALRDSLDARLRLLSQDRNSILFDRMDQASKIGTDPFASIVIPGQLSQISDAAVRFVHHFVDDNGLQLSDRLWRLDENASQVVSQAVQRAVIMGHSASQSAQEFLSRGEDIPRDLQQKMSAATAMNIARDAGAALMTGDGNPHAHAMRVFRTEINRAHGAAYQEAAFKVPEVIGTRFQLSPAHPRPDICDMHAKANLYGLGPGVYPKGKSPWPAHPNTLSFETVVFKDEVKPEDKKKETRIDWLNKQAPGLQEAVLDSRAKAAALRRGMLSQNEIATPWRIVKKRLQDRGVNVEDLLPASPVSSDTPAAKLARVRPVGIPVSDALDIRGAKKATTDALAAIGQVHGDGKLPKIPVISSRGRSTLGAYHYTYGGEARKISVSSFGTHQAMTATHEIGHFLDHQAMYKPGINASENHDQLMKGWLKAVNNSKAIQTLRDMLSNPAGVTLKDGVTFRPDRRHINYLLSVREMWARAYAQYIAVRGGSMRMASELSDILHRQRNAPLNYPQQWEPDDFAPIAEEMDKVFDSLGWRVKHGS